MIAEAPDEGVTRNGLLGGRVTLLQPRKGYRAAVDPVLLAAAVPARPGEHVVELGSGTGAAALCLLVRVPSVRVTGIEPDPESRALAAQSAALTGVADRLTLLAGRAGDLPPLGPVDQVMANPPYLDPARHRAPRDPHRAAAHMAAAEAEAGGLDAWLAAARRLLRPGGRLTMIHRADVIDALVAALRPGFGSVEILPIWPRSGAAARRVILRARRAGRGAARLAPGLVLHEPGGTFTAAARAILEQGAPLDG